MKKRSGLIFFALLLFVVIISSASNYPPDYDYEHKYIVTAPSGLSAGWSGDSAYVSWDKIRNKEGSYVDGYRLYRAISQDSAYVLVNIADEVDNDNDGQTDEWYELIPAAYYMDTASQLSAAGIYQSVPFCYKVTAAMVKEADGIYSCFESGYSSPVEIVRETDYRCFIATAAFGSPMADEIKTLCSFRDNVLMQTKTGRCIVGCYYRLSPPAADFIRKRPPLKTLLRLYLKPTIMLIEALNLSP